MLLILSITAAQTSDTLIYEQFETGGASFTINSADEGGVDAATGYNQWIINNEYTGGSGQFSCAGFPVTFTVPDTPQQPSVITGGPTTNYLHITSDEGQLAGILNCSFLAASGLCGNNEYNFSRMSADVNTAAYDSVTVSFLWLCEGGSAAYGEVYYSLDSGTSWTQITSPVSQFNSQSTWTTSTISLTAFAGQPALRFGFRFVNEISFSANDPGFGVDEFLITATNVLPPLPPPVAAFSVSDSSFCESSCVDFTDLTANNPVSWLWIFQGSTTSFSTLQNPGSICYNTPGTYPVTLIVENASGTDTLTVSTITVNANPAAPIITASGDTLSAPLGFSSYEWSLNNFTIPGADSVIYVAASNGSYTVSVTDSNGCTASSAPFVLNTSIDEQGNNYISIYPNPTAEILSIESSQMINRISIYEITGREVLQKNLINPSKKISLNISEISAGLYLLNWYDKNNESHFIKFLKK